MSNRPKKSKDYNHDNFDMKVKCMIVDLHIFSLISRRDILSINRLTLILKIFVWCDSKLMVLPMKTRTSVLKVLTSIISGIAACSNTLAVIILIALMSASTFITTVILYDQPSHLKPAAG